MECKVKNIPIYYEVIGQGKPIVMIHGYTPDHRLMKGCMEHTGQLPKSNLCRS